MGIQQIFYVAIPTVAACLIIPFLPSRGKAAVTLLPVLFNAGATSWLAIESLNGATIERTIFAGSVMGDVLLRIDPLSAWFILLLNLVVISGAWYGTKYMRPYSAQGNSLSIHWISYIIFHLSMLLVCTVQQTLAFLVAWELMTLTSFLLLMFEHHRFQTLSAGLNYLVQMHAGASFLTLAFIWASISSGSYTFDALRASLATPGGTWLFLLFFAGFSTKAGFIPLHTWLPHAHPAAPSHISGVMSGIMVKMGIFGILRLSSWLSRDILLLGNVILVIALLTALYGILNGAVHRDYKRILAFSTIENIGLIGIGIGLALIGKGTGHPTLATLGFSAALIHVLNHSLYKSLLFFTAGELYHHTHTRNMEQLGGLTKKLPLTSFMFLCGSLAICGFPPFNGFVSKLLLFNGILEGFRLPDFKISLLMVSAMAGLALTSGVALFAFARAYGIIFLGKLRDQNIHPRTERPSPAHIPLFVILLLMLLAGIAPQVIWLPAEQVSRYVFLPEAATNSLPLSLLSLPERAGFASLLFLAVTTAIYFLRSRALRKAGARYAPTWNCGYSVASPRMQYTANSFARSLASLFYFLLPEKKKFSDIDPEAVFPSPRSYQSFFAEFFEKRILERATNALFVFMGYFSFLQRGRVQVYILYGLIFILLLILATLLNLL